MNSLPHLAEGTQIPMCCVSPRFLLWFALCSTFERYVAEVNSGQLRWGIVHTDKFWRENVRALEANDFKVLKYVPTQKAAQTLRS